MAQELRLSRAGSSWRTGGHRPNEAPARARVLRPGHPARRARRTSAPTALQVARIAAQMAEFGYGPRHLRPFRLAADRELALVEQVVKPMARGPQQDGAVKGRGGRARRSRRWRCSCTWPWSRRAFDPRHYSGSLTASVGRRTDRCAGLLWAGVDGFVAVEVVGVRVEMPSNAPIVLRPGPPAGRCLPIWIGPNEAAAIAMAQQGVAAPRPLTHDLFVATCSPPWAPPFAQVRITAAARRASSTRSSSVAAQRRGRRPALRRDRPRAARGRPDPGGGRGAGRGRRRHPERPSRRPRGGAVPRVPRPDIPSGLRVGQATDKARHRGPLGDRVPGLRAALDPHLRLRLCSGVSRARCVDAAFGRPPSFGTGIPSL